MGSIVMSWLFFPKIALRAAVGHLGPAMHHLPNCPCETPPFLVDSVRFQILVRFFVYPRIKPHNPLLVQVPVYSFEF